MNIFKKKLFLFLLVQYPITLAMAQSQGYSHADTLRGMLTKFRSCYDVYFYDLTVKINTSNHSIIGSNAIFFHTKENFTQLQVDLFSNLKINSITFRGKELEYTREADAVFITFSSEQIAGDTGKLFISYSGIPISAKNPPWDGGFVWKKDEHGKDWIGVACEGTGASCWWPNKDYVGDEPDSMRINIIAPPDLVCASNGQLRKKTPLPTYEISWEWFVSYPINNYNVTFNLADYVLLHDVYKRSDGSQLALDYYVMNGEEAQAQQHFQQVKQMLACFEKYFGPYPFTRDGYKLIETVYWGMEHQSAVSYGNQFRNNKWGFDFIIIHESAHEWWGNNVSCEDMADMWIHESLATYSESLYEECMFNYDSALAYLVNQRWNIEDKQPIIGDYGVNYEHGDNDQYYKGSWMMHTFRNVLANDSLFFSILKGIQHDFAYQCVNSDQLIAYINSKCGTDYTSFFNQYLHYSSPPVFSYSLKQKGNDVYLFYKWKSDVQGFHMPLKIVASSSGDYFNKKKNYIRIFPTTAWQKVLIKGLNKKDFSIDQDEFYVKIEFIRKLKGVKI